MDEQGWLTVVGWFPFISRSAIWRGLHSTWCVVEGTDASILDISQTANAGTLAGAACREPHLGDVTLPSGVVIHRWITEIHDVNDYGHAVGVMTEVFDVIPPVVRRWAVAMLPVADLDRDLDVDGADLGILLGDWGFPTRRSDLNGDGIVNGADMALLTGQWSGSSMPALVRITNPPECLSCGGIGLTQAAQSGEGDVSGNADPEAELAANLALLGFTSLDAFVAWGLSAAPDQITEVMEQLTSLFASEGGG